MEGGKEKSESRKVCRRTGRRLGLERERRVKRMTYSWVRVEEPQE